jgi:hypothetical protein
MWEFLAAVISAFVALIGLLVGWRRARESALRREEVLNWSNSAIRHLQSLVLVCQSRGDQLPKDIAEAKLREIFYETSVLAEQGRLFFKNEIKGAYGQEKPQAYRGRRPEILDQLLIAHAIAGAFGAAEASSRLRMTCVAQDAARRFVTLAQQEVGRSRTASAETRKGGTGTSLQALMQDVQPERLEPSPA